MLNRFATLGFQNAAPAALNSLSFDVEIPQPMMTAKPSFMNARPNALAPNNFAVQYLKRLKQLAISRLLRYSCQ